MNAMMWLAPVSVLLGLIGLAAFIWSFAAGQYDDPRGDAARILLDDADGPPAPQDQISAGDAPDAG